MAPPAAVQSSLLLLAPPLGSWLVLLLWRALSEEVCDASLPGSCPSSVLSQRQILDKTPTPCLKAYSEEFLQKSAEAHIAGIESGHEVPHMLMLLGGSGSGKSTFMRHLAKHGINVSGMVAHGLDDYLKYLPEFQKTLSDPSAVYKDAADACYGGGAIPIAKAAQMKIISGRLHVMYEETGKNLDRILKRVLPPFEKAGYRITAALVDNDIEVAKERAKGRFLKEGRYASPEYIEGTFDNVPENFKKLKASGRLHDVVYCDNSCMRDGTTSAEASAMSGCLQCWRDTLENPEGTVAAGTPLIPHTALHDGVPAYFHPAAR